jgi:hypothetical protein
LSLINPRHLIHLQPADKKKFPYGGIVKLLFYFKKQPGINFKFSNHHHLF